MFLVQDLTKSPNFYSKSRISKKAVKSIIEVAQTAPSGDNIKPFGFEWNKDGFLKIYRNSHRDAHPFNIHGVSALFNLGCTLEYIRVAALKFGYDIVYQLNSPEDTTGPIALVLFTETKHKLNSEFIHLQKRCTDRRNFSGGDIKTIEQIARQSEIANFIEITSVNCNNKKMIEIFCEAEQTLFKWKDVTKALFKWLRLSYKEVKNSNDGIYYFKLGIKKMDLLFIRLYRKLIFLHPILSIIFAYKLKKDTISKIKSSAGILCFSTYSERPREIVRMSILATRVWIQLNASGYSVQPLSQSSILLSAINKYGIPQKCPIKHGEKLMFSFQKLIKLFRLHPKTTWVWTFRVGLNLDAEKIKKYK